MTIQEAWLADNNAPDYPHGVCCPRIKSGVTSIHPQRMQPPLGPECDSRPGSTAHLDRSALIAAHEPTSSPSPLMAPTSLPSPSPAQVLDPISRLPPCRACLAMTCSFLFLWPELRPGLPHHRSRQVLATPLLQVQRLSGAHHALLAAQDSLGMPSALDTPPLMPYHQLPFPSLSCTLASYLGFSTLLISTTEVNWDLTLRQIPG